jgi:hypothetical protein
MLDDLCIETLASKYLTLIGDHWVHETGIREDQVEDFAREIERAVVSANGWRSIATAPKDGTVVDLWFCDGFRIPNCRWNENSNSWAYYSLNGTWTLIDVDVDGDEDELTYWRPVSDGPEV